MDDAQNIISAKKERVWELDALRGLFILCVIAVHTIYDLEFFFGVPINTPDWFDFVQEYGGILFILISGICATLGTKFVKRGLIVLGGAFAISAVTYGMYKLDMSDESVIIYFGILHCLSICMLLYALLKHIPTFLLPFIAVGAICLGFWFEFNVRSGSVWTCSVGIMPEGFETADYFPIFPNIGYFMLGIFLGRTLYKKKKTLIPAVNPKNPIISVFTFCGRHSLIIYLVHQPLVYGLLELIFTVF